MDMKSMRAAAVVSSFGLVAACQFPELPPLEGHSVGGTVVGLWTGAQLRLELERPDGETEQYVHDREGAFAFESRLELGAAYRVEVAAQPNLHTCSVVRGSGIIEADVGDVQIMCTSDIPVNAVLASPTPFVFDAQMSRQSVDVSVLETEARFIVTAPAGAIVAVGGVATPLGVLSEPTPLTFGNSEVVISVGLGELSRRYVVDIDRGNVLPADYARLVASNGDPSDNFGETIAVDGDRLVVGSIGEASNGIEPDNSMVLAGAAYVFRRSGTAWVQEQYLKGQPVSVNRLFGLALAIEGDTIAVGAHGLDMPGAVHVFRRVSSQWDQAIRVMAPTPATTDTFGFSVAIADPLLAVGDLSCQCVYVYRRNGATWSYDATVTSPQAGNFGFRIALTGTVLVVAAPLDASAATGTMPTPSSDIASSGNGAVYAYRETAPSTWTLEAFVKPLTSVPNGNFGSALSASGQAFVVGSARRDDAHFVEYVGGAWSQPVRLQSTQQTQAFGSAVALRRDVIAASEVSADKVHLFRRSGSTWIEAGAVTRSSGMAGDRFGHSVVLSGSGLIGGAHRTESDKGAAHAVR